MEEILSESGEASSRSAYRTRLDLIAGTRWCQEKGDEGDGDTDGDWEEDEEEDGKGDGTALSNIDEERDGEDDEDADGL